MKLKQKALNTKYIKIKNQLEELRHNDRYQATGSPDTENVSDEQTQRKPNKPDIEIQAQDPQLEVRREFEKEHDQEEGQDYLSESSKEYYFKKKI